jgi:RNA polymerase sigma-54 factor
VAQLQGRYNRVLDIAKVAVAEQADFFRHGEERMRNLTMDTVATRTGMPRPTVSRAVKGRYYLFEGKVLALRDLFTHRSKAGRASQGKLHALIRQIVAEEDPKHPLSDAAIADQLRIYGLREARRTVAKHRERAGVLPLAMRRRS